MLNNNKFHFNTVKNIIIVLALVLTSAYSQTTYQVEPGIKRNKIILTIENASASLSTSALEIVETSLSEFIDIKNNSITISNIAKSSEKEVEIEFDVLSDAPINETDTLHFVLSNAKGENWSKEIILEYRPPKEFVLNQNYPNPFNPSTTIKYSIPLIVNGKSQLVTLKIYDILGREVATLVNKEQQPGNYEVVFNAKKLSSGTYFYRLSSSDFSKTIKIILLK
ncbi:MAG: T9SS type A sorting domain-containing protein [Melioribacteraceae bacterium]|nr:T9SS type A sorting domain-containing protein [Melioribacteraceae bacterium]